MYALCFTRPPAGTWPSIILLHETNRGSLLLPRSYFQTVRLMQQDLGVVVRMADSLAKLSLDMKSW